MAQMAVGEMAALDCNAARRNRSDGMGNAQVSGNGHAAQRMLNGVTAA